MNIQAWLLQAQLRRPAVLAVLMVLAVLAMVVLMGADAEPAHAGRRWA